MNEGLSWDAPVRDAPDVLRSFLRPRGRTRLEAVYRRELERLSARRTARARREGDGWYQGPDRAHLFGVALSGGGIRSATLSSAPGRAGEAGQTFGRQRPHTELLRAGARGHRRRAPEPWHGGGILVYVKASELAGKRVRSHGELRSRADLAYRTFHPDFPHEPTTDQFFNQEQWRAYFELGSILADAALGQALTFDPRAPAQRGQSKRRDRVAMDALIARYTDILRKDAR